MDFWKKFQFWLLVMAILIFLLQTGMRLCNFTVPDDVNFIKEIWAIILLLIDPKMIHERYIKAPKEEAP